MSQLQRLLLVVRLRELGNGFACPDGMPKRCCFVPLGAQPPSYLGDERVGVVADLMPTNATCGTQVAYFTSLPWQFAVAVNRPPDNMSVLSSSRCSSESTFCKLRITTAQPAHLSRSRAARRRGAAVRALRHGCDGVQGEACRADGVMAVCAVRATLRLSTPV